MFFNRKFNYFLVFIIIFLLSIAFFGRNVLAQSTATPVPSEETEEAACDTSTSPSLELAWQSGGSPDEIIVVLPSQFGELDMFPTGWIAVDFEGNAYVVIDIEGISIIKKFDTDGNFVMSFEFPVSGITGIAVDSLGNIYASDFQNAQVLKFDAAGNFLLQWATEPPTGPTGIGVDPEGNVVVANHRTHEHYVQSFDSSGQLLAQWGSNGEGDGQFTARSRTGPSGLAVDENGKVFVLDTDNSRLQIFDAEGNFLSTIGSFGREGQGQFDRPFGVSVDGEGNIYVVDQHFIQKFDADGQFLTQWDVTEGELNSAGYYLAMAVDSQGNIYWVALGEVFATEIQETVTIMVLKKFRQC